MLATELIYVCTLHISLQCKSLALNPGGEVGWEGKIESLTVKGPSSQSTSFGLAGLLIACSFQSKRTNRLDPSDSRVCTRMARFALKGITVLAHQARVSGEEDVLVQSALHVCTRNHIYVYRQRMAVMSSESLSAVMLEGCHISPRTPEAVYQQCMARSWNRASLRPTGSAMREA